MKNELEEEIDAFRARFMSHIPDNTEDISLPILKAHLLAEELLSDFISSKVNNPKLLTLENSYWSFKNKLELASALASEEHGNVWVWNALEKLNSLRNQLSHSLEPKDLEKKITQFKSAVTPYVLSIYRGSEITIYRYVISVVSGLFVLIKSEEGKII